MKQLMNDEMIARSLKRMSHEIIERNRGIDNLVLVGIKTRGEFLASRIADNLYQIEGHRIEAIAIDISKYRDDVINDNANDILEVNYNFKDKIVILVDDVLFRGRTARAAVEYVLKHGRAEVIQLAVLIDRGHRQLPIKPDYVGKNIPTSEDEVIKCCLKEVDGIDSVYINNKQVK